MKPILHNISFTLFILLLSMICYPTFSQVSRGGMPRSITFSMAPDTGNGVELEPPQLTQLQEEDRQQPLPYRFAVNIPVNLDPNNSGNWTTAMDGSLVWRLSISAPGALALTLYFDKFRLPEGGRLFVYNPARTQVLGAFTSANNNLNNSFATSLIQGDELTLEYNTGNASNLPELHVSEVAYAYRGVSDPRLKTGFGSAGACEVNVNCSEGNNWQDIKRGVVRIEVKRGSATLWCSGSVVNNTSGDYAPYVLTADHCGKYATTEDISKWIFYFHYESSGCPNPLFEPGNKSITGAQLKAHADVNGSDFFLVLLNQSIPDDYNAYYNGWSRENIPSPSGVTIHHPQGDIKKISTYITPLTTSTWSGYSHPSHWRVTWAGTANGHGVTEGGSSGSPIFDYEGHLLGTLTGGDSFCDSSSLNLPDYYGKFSYHWDQNGTDSASVLKYWLDPDSTGVVKLSGKVVGMEEKKTGLRFALYPNPVQDMVTLQSAEAGERVRVSLTDIRGRVLFKRDLTLDGSGNTTLDLSGFEPGIYFVTLTGSDGQVVRKIIKQ